MIRPTQWYRGTLGDVISSIRGGFSVKCDDRQAFPFEKAVLKTGAVLNGKFDSSKNKYVPPSEHMHLRTPVSASTIVFCRKNSEETIGAAALVEMDEPNIYLSDLLWELRPAPCTDLYWLVSILKSDSVRQRIQKEATGTQHTMKNISQDRLLSVPIAVPPLPEQRKIAEVLRTWDGAIEKASQLIEIRRVYYRGLRERLINWRTDPRKRLGSLVVPISRAIPRPKEPYRALGVRSHGKGTFHRMAVDPTSVDMETLYVACGGDLIINITFAWEGAIALVPPEHDGGLVSHRFPTFVPMSGKVSARYLHHALRMPRFTYLLGLVSPGGAGRNRVLNKGDFLALEVPSPILGRQEKIASCLDFAEDAVTRTTEYRDALTRQKRGLMQKLLTGEWRIAIDEPVAAGGGTP